MTTILSCGRLILVHIIINTILTSPSLSNIIIRQLFFTVYICTFLHRVLRRRNFYIHGARWLTKRLTGNLFLAHFPYVDSIGLDKLVYLSSNNEIPKRTSWEIFLPAMPRCAHTCCIIRKLGETKSFAVPCGI